MVASINDIMEKHCEESRTAKTFFAKMRHCKSFLTCLKEIEVFIYQEKMLVPSRFIMIPTFKDHSRHETFGKRYPIPTAGDLSLRHSFNNGRLRRTKTK
jgi:hypothetical protein